VHARGLRDMTDQMAAKLFHFGGKSTEYHRKRSLARPAGLEPAASRLEVSRSIQMSYGRAPGV
jgi:hypothetical protein